MYLIGDSLSVGILPYLRGAKGSPVVGASLPAMVHQVDVMPSTELVVHVMGGTNDAAGGASQAEIVRRTHFLVDKIKKRVPQAKIIVTPPPPSAYPWNTALPSSYPGLNAFVGSQSFPAASLSIDGVHPKNYEALAKIVGHNINLALNPSRTWMMMGLIAGAYLFSKVKKV